MEVAVALTHKTTILLPPQLHRRLRRLARHRGVSLGHLIRHACERQYGEATEDERLVAVGELAALSLPVAPPGELKQQSVVDPDKLQP